MILFVGTLILMIFVKWASDWEKNGIPPGNIPAITPTFMKFFFGGDNNDIKPGEKKVYILPE